MEKTKNKALTCQSSFQCVVTPFIIYYLSPPPRQFALLVALCGISVQLCINIENYAHKSNLPVIFHTIVPENWMEIALLGPSRQVTFLTVWFITFGKYHITRDVFIQNIMHKTDLSYGYKLKAFFTTESGDPLLTQFICSPSSEIEFNTRVPFLNICQAVLTIRNTTVQQFSGQAFNPPSHRGSPRYQANHV